MRTHKNPLTSATETASPGRRTTRGRSSAVASGLAAATPAILATAAEKANEAGVTLVRWAKKHPVRTAVAAGALLAAATVLTTAMRRRMA